jgi:hypothetical protein
MTPKAYLNACLLTAAFSLAGCAGMVLDGGLIIAHEKIEKGEYHDALSHLASAELSSKLTTDIRAEIYWLRGQCYEGLKDIPSAIGVYKFLIDHHRLSPYAYQAKERVKALEKK